jgi:low affinity Fe/Cu permease
VEVDGEAARHVLVQRLWVTLLGYVAGMGSVQEKPAEEERWHRATQWVSRMTSALGSFPAIIGSVVVIVVWALTGPIFRFSDTWQLVINTSTTIITFNMVFVIQNTQNRDGRAIQTKLDAILKALERGDERLIGLEEKPEAAIRRHQNQVRESVQRAASAESRDATPARLRGSS